ncbi:MAG: hypothetical protein Q9172_007843 [Xanthocarpia lactea]
MHSFSIALFAAGALAGNLYQLVPRELQVRQSQAFRPGTRTGQGETCADAFGAGHIDCNGVCYNPNDDETCCPGGGDAYPCEANSFCLNVDGYCCPDGLDRATCAAQFGVTLPSDDDDDSATSAISGSTTVADTGAAFGPSTTAITVATPYPVPGNATVIPPAATGTAGPGRPGDDITPFTGAASNVKVVGAGLAAGLLGVVALLL